MIERADEGCARRGGRGGAAVADGRRCPAAASSGSRSSFSVSLAACLPLHQPPFALPPLLSSQCSIAIYDSVCLVSAHLSFITIAKKADPGGLATDPASLSSSPSLKTWQKYSEKQFSVRRPSATAFLSAAAAVAGRAGGDRILLSERCSTTTLCSELCPSIWPSPNFFSSSRDGARGVSRKRLRTLRPQLRTLCGLE